MTKCVSNLFSVRTLLVLAKREIQELLSIGEALKAVEYAFKLEAEGRVIMPPKLYLNTPNG